jgi:hypothetical protein
MRTRLEPKRDGNPKALLLALYLASLLALSFLALGPKAEMPGYYRMRFRFRTSAFPQGLPVEALVGARRGEGVLLVLRSGTGLLLNPEDPRLLLAWKEAA